MNTTILNLALWIPFGLLAFIYGLIFCISGYKKGLYRALISVGATVVAGIVSVIISRLASPRLSEIIFNAIPPEAMGLEGASAQIVGVFIKGVIQNVAALVLFSLLLFILSIVFKCIFGNIKKEQLATDNKGLKWAGFFVRLVEALALVLVLLVPLYGTIGAYIPAVNSLMSSEMMNGGSGVDNESGEPLDPEMDEAKELLNALAKHPLVQVSGKGPVSSIYKGLSGVKAGEGSVNVPEMAQTAEKLISMISALPAVPENEISGEVQKIIVYMRENVVNKSWFYGLFNAVKGEAVKLINEHSSEIPAEARGIVDEIIKSLDISEKQLREAMEEFLDFAQYVLENRLIEKAETEEIAVLYTDDFLSRFGELANCNEVALSVKRIIHIIALTDFFGTPDEAMQFLNTHPITLKTDPAAQKKEAGALLIMMKGVNELVILEGMVRQPDFGYDVMKQYVNEDMLAQSVFHGSFGADNPLTVYLQNNPDLYNSLLAKLKECETTQPSENYYNEYVHEILYQIMRDNNMAGGFTGSFGVTDGEGGFTVSGDGQGGSFIISGGGGIVSGGGDYVIKTEDGGTGTVVQVFPKS